MSVSWTEIAVQHILMPFMTPQSVPAKTTGAPLDRLLPNPKSRLINQSYWNSKDIGCFFRDSY
jgi:hypothetical protein